MRLCHDCSQFLIDRRIWLVKRLERNRVHRHPDNLFRQLSATIPTARPGVAGHGANASQLTFLNQQFMVGQVVFCPLIDRDDNTRAIVLQVLNVPKQIPKSSLQIATTLVF